MRLLLFMIAGFVLAADNQVGISPRVSVPKLVKQMESQSSSGFTDREMLEIKKLHETDAVLLQKIIANSQKNGELERFVATLDVTVDTRLLTEAVSDIRELKKVQKDQEDTAKEERKSSRDMIRNIWSGTILLVIGALITGFVHLLRWYWRRKDPDSRGARHKDLINMSGELQTAITKKQSTDEKLEQMNTHLEFLDRRVDRVGTNGTIPIT